MTNNAQLMEEIIKEVAVSSAEKIYEDGLQPAVREAGEFFGTVLGFLNHVVMHKPKCITEKYKCKLEAFKKELNKEFSEIPKENLKDAPLNIIGPALESLQYNIEEDEIVKMYKNLLLSSIDDRKRSHPSYVKIIEQMDVVDATIFNSLKDNIGFHAVAHFRLLIDGTDEYHVDAFPEYYIAKKHDNINMFDVSSSLIRLVSLGLIKISDGHMVNGCDYSIFENDESIINRKDEYIDKLYKNGEVRKTTLEMIHSSYCITSLGYNFLKIAFNYDSLKEADNMQYTAVARPIKVWVE